jgi:hypothetical protein
MNRYSKTSEVRLDTATWTLQRVFRGVLDWWDHTILFGHRGEKEQTAAVAAGNSTLPFGKSKHNALPSLAVDAAPFYPEVPTGGIDWRTDAELMKAAKEGRFEDVKTVLENIKRWHTFGGFVRGYGAALGIKIRWGGDWNSDCRFNDHRLVDLPHFEVEK